MGFHAQIIEAGVHSPSAQGTVITPSAWIPRPWGLRKPVATTLAWLPSGEIRTSPLHGQIAAVSVGIYRGEPVLDLDYVEDSAAETDMNVVMNDSGAFVEVQGTAEGHAFRRAELDALLDLADSGIRTIMAAQSAVLDG